ncbi:MAG TPA: Cof-type HAD-IIB family hydrolase [Selenomonadales bacterium]|nr:Cof-type HAD-IIB family hydrolase [Selenomonadales bacterium]
MHAIKLIVLDLDGTLLDSNKKIPESTVQYIKKVSGQGIKVVVASSRMPAGALPVYEQLGITTPLIALGGSYVFIPGNGEVLYNQPMTLPDYQYAVRLLEKHQTYFKVYGRKYFYIRNMDERTRIFSQTHHSPCRSMEGESLAVIPEPAYNLFALDIADGLLQLYYGELRKHCPQLQVFAEGKTGLGLVDKQAGKENALLAISEYYGCKLENILAIGNECNDVKMIQWAGIGLAMANGCEEIKKIADAVVGDNDHLGVENALKQYLA